MLKQWSRDFDQRVEPLVKQTEKLHSVLANDMVKAIAYLGEAIKTLAAYSETSFSNPADATPPQTSETPST
jgi:hypothetical protein